MSKLLPISIGLKVTAMGLRWNGPDKEAPNPVELRPRRRKDDLRQITPFEVLDKLRSRWHNQSMENATEEGATMKRFIGYYTDGDMTTDSPMYELEFRADSWESARKRYELFGKADEALLMGLFSVPVDASDDAIAALATEFHRQWCNGIQEPEKLTAALTNPRASRMHGTN